ncbi:MAG TPA: TonB-dependent receptor [Tenuifilaceae bacterium]|nr:TonB-dependent receptor [Tenuifilaceae bacterium]
MSKFVTLFALLLLINEWALFAQSLDSIIVLNEVSVVANKDKYLLGSKIKTVDTAMLSIASGKSITELLNISLPIYVKQDAGGLATLRIRGTSPNHTAVMFNGININSQTLGHSNVSNLPVFLFEEVRVQYGSSSSLYGTDAIGGSLQLNNKTEWNKGLGLGIQQDIGSFGSVFTGVKAGFSNSKFHYSLKGYRSLADNNFPFLNTAVKDFEKNTFVKDTMRNASISNYGILQNFSLKISEKLFLHSNLWYDDNWHQIQPNMSTNYYGGTFEELKNKHLRVVSGLKYYHNKHRVTADFGFVSDYQLYQKDYAQTISTRTYKVNTNYFNSQFFDGNLNVGFSYSYLKPDVYSYSEGIDESRIDFFILYIRSITKQLSIISNFREAVVTDYKLQFAPSIGLNYLALNDYKNNLNIKVSVSKSFKTPTFNDRFWIPGGNPDILPEKSLSYELNSNYELSEDSWRFKSNLTLYYMTIDNLIQWVNRDIWRPENIKKTNNRGVEVSTELSKSIYSSKITSGLSYSFTKATEVKNYDDNSIPLGRQLMYTPKHLGNFYVVYAYKNWNFMFIANYTGDRYTESYKLLKGYLLLNASLEKQIDYKGHHLAVSFRVNNLLNKVYQNQYLYAMPGINYNFSLKYSINNLKTKTK